MKNSLRTRRGDPKKFEARPELDVQSWRNGELVETLAEALSCLPNQEREVVRLAYWKNLPNTLIADMMRIDPRTVKRRHEAALRNLRKHYGVTT